MQCRLLVFSRGGSCFTSTNFRRKDKFRHVFAIYLLTMHPGELIWCLTIVFNLLYIALFTEYSIQSLVNVKIVNVEWESRAIFLTIYDDLYKTYL